MVVPAARRIVARAAGARAAADGHHGVRRHAGQRADLALDAGSSGAATIGVRVESRPAPCRPLRRREHHGVEDRRRAGDAGRALQRRAIEVADPDADGHVARVADRPVVVIGLRRAGLHRDRERELEAAAAAEDVLARVWSSERMSVIQNAVRGDTSVAPAARAVVSPSSSIARRRDPLAAARERRIGGDQLVEPHFGVAERQAEPVVRRRCDRSVVKPGAARGTAAASARRARTRAPRPARSPSRPGRAARAAGRDSGRRSCAGCRARRLRRSESATGRRRSTLAGVKPVLERERVGERLQRRARLPRRDGAVDRAAVLRRRSSRPSLPTPATRRVALSSTTTATLRGAVPLERRRGGSR